LDIFKLATARGSYLARGLNGYYPRPMGLKILLWNTEGNKQSLEVLLSEAEFDLLAIQEPWINTQTKSTYYPRGSRYYLVYASGGRAAIFVHRKFDIGQWDYEATPEWCRVSFPGLGTSQGEGLSLWSIYNPGDNRTVPQTLLEGPHPTYPTVLAGDFNLHDLHWDQFGRYEREAEPLLELAI
jgi:hypothetical protein